MTNKDVGKREGTGEGGGNEENEEKRESYVNKTESSGHGKAPFPFISSRVIGQPESYHCSSSYSSAG